MSEQPPTAIVIDSTTYLPQELIDRHGMAVVSLYVTLDGEQRREVDIGDYRAFYEQLKASNEAVTTSQPSVGDFLDVWVPILESGREIVSIHLSSKISGTFKTAESARDQLVADGRGGERVHLIDSRSGAGGIGLCALAAASEADRGGDAAAVRAKFDQAYAGLQIRVAVDTLEYLRRGGRIGGAQAFLGTALKIKPILSFEAEVVPVAKVRTRAKALEHLREFARELAAKEAQLWCVQHVDDIEAANEFADACRGYFGSDPAFISEMGPVSGAHTGPGLVGLGSIPASSLE